jgi:hypothetical protein
MIVILNKCGSSENKAGGQTKVLSQIFIKVLGTKKQTNKIFSPFPTNQEMISM